MTTTAWIRVNMGVVGVHDAANHALASGHTRLTNPLTVYLSVDYLPVTDVGETSRLAN